MSDYIKRNVALDAMRDVMKQAKHLRPPLYDAIDNVKNLPSADVMPVRHGHWIEKNTNKDGTHNIYCNECGEYIKSKGHANSWYVRHALLYCPNCGAKMDGGNDE